MLCPQTAFLGPNIDSASLPPEGFHSSPWVDPKANWQTNNQTEPPSKRPVWINLHTRFRNINLTAIDYAPITRPRLRTD